MDVSTFALIKSTLGVEALSLALVKRTLDVEASSLALIKSTLERNRFWSLSVDGGVRWKG